MKDGIGFGPWLRKYRRASDLTQQELASQVGCSAETIAKVETGERKPSKQVAERLAELVGVPVDEREAFVFFARADSSGVGAVLRSAQDASSPWLPSHVSESNPWRAVYIGRQLRQDNLPAQPNLFVGREQQLTATANLLRRRGVRLLSLIGPPGIGKTRLALEVAAEMLEVFPSGVSFVNLASISDPTLVASTIARRLGLREAGRRPVLDSLKNYLKDTNMLLVLDNFEQVLTASSLVVELLAVASHLKVLVTSRIALNVYGEFKLKIPPMDMPDHKHLPPVETLARFEAIELFSERALSSNPGFTLTKDNAPAIVEICQMLDGLPLAIELAAARTEFLSPQVMLERLRDDDPGSTLKLLTGGPSDLPPRQRTLRAAVNWSYTLLSREEQTLFRRMSVFVGGFTLEAACALGDAEREEILATLLSLVDKSLLQQESADEHSVSPTSEGEDDGDMRFSMMETVRDFGCERLVEKRELDRAEHSHAHYYLALAERASIEVRGRGQARWLQRLENELDNMRKALQWAIKTMEIESGLRIAGALGWFWFRRGHFTEGREQLILMLSLADQVPSSKFKVRPDTLDLRRPRARALGALARLVEHRGDYQQALALYEESRQVYSELDDRQGVGNALCGLAFTTFRQGSQNEAKSLYEQALAMFRDLGDERGIATAIRGLGDIALYEGDYSSARALYIECMSIFQKLGDKYVVEVATLYNGLANAALDQGDFDSARVQYQDGLTIFQKLGDQYGVVTSMMGLAEVARCQGAYVLASSLNEETILLWKALGEKWNMAMALHNLGHVTQHQGDLERAGSIFAEGLLLFHEANAKVGIAMCLTGLAGVAATHSNPAQAERAARLFGAAQSLLDSTGTTLQAADLDDYTHNLEFARSQLDQPSFDAAWEQGSAMDLDEVVKYALEGV